MTKPKKRTPGRPARPRALGLSLERRRAGWSRAKAWTHFGVSRATWARWEDGAAAPPSSILERVAAAWGVDVGALMAKPSAKLARSVADLERRRALAADLERLAAEHGPDAVRALSVDL